MTDKIDDGGPAFGGVRREKILESKLSGEAFYGDVVYDGMSLRDLLALEALKVLMRDPERNIPKSIAEPAPFLARSSYAIADAMLAVRKVQP